MGDPTLLERLQYGFQHTYSRAWHELKGIEERITGDSVGSGSPSSTIIEDKLYIICGYRILIYDIPADTWEKKESNPAIFYNHSAAALDGDIYVFGGQYNYSAYKYSPENDKWEGMPRYPGASAVHSSAVALEGEIYVVGGGTTNTEYQLYKYNPATETWTRLEDRPLVSSYTASVVYGGEIYVIGSYTGSNAINKYNPVTDTWTELSNIPMVLRNRPAAAVYGDDIYVTGYYLESSGTVFVFKFYRYNITLDTWFEMKDLEHKDNSTTLSLMETYVGIIYRVMLTNNATTAGLFEYRASNVPVGKMSPGQMIYYSAGDRYSRLYVDGAEIPPDKAVRSGLGGIVTARVAQEGSYVQGWISQNIRGKGGD